jgi:hypothetical protein
MQCRFKKTDQLNCMNVWWASVRTLRAGDALLRSRAFAIGRVLMKQLGIRPPAYA